MISCDVCSTFPRVARRNAHDENTALEDIAKASVPVKRTSSISERTWLHQLVDKHGTDTAAMARDRGLNAWQKTEGEMVRMIRKAGGFEKMKGL